MFELKVYLIGLFFQYLDVLGVQEAQMVPLFQIHQVFLHHLEYQVVLEGQVHQEDLVLQLVQWV